MWKVTFKFNNLELCKLGQIIDNGEDKNGDDVFACGPVVGDLEEGVAHRDEALYRDSHGGVD